MRRENQILGAEGEKLAEDFLKKKGYQILSRNWKCKFGELDIVAARSEGKFLRKTKTIIFVEVKTIDASDAQFVGQAEQNVNYFKQQHLVKSAECYLKFNNVSPETSWQIDIIAIEYDRGAGRHKIRHLERAVWGS